MRTRSSSRTIVTMTPDDLATVQRSWTDVRSRQADLTAALTERFEAAGTATIDAATRARWLFAAVEQLVGLLPVPSALATHARSVGASWPDPHTAPSFATEGRAWLDAAAACSPAWSDATAQAWKQAWLLLSDVLAAESLSPFADAASSHPTPPAPPGPGAGSLPEVSSTPPNRGPLP